MTTRNCKISGSSPWLEVGACERILVPTEKHALALYRPVASDYAFLVWEDTGPNRTRFKLESAEGKKHSFACFCGSIAGCCSELYCTSKEPPEMSDGRGFESREHALFRSQIRTDIGQRISAISQEHGICAMVGRHCDSIPVSGVKTLEVEDWVWRQEQQRELAKAHAGGGI